MGGAEFGLTTWILLCWAGPATPAQRVLGMSAVKRRVALFEQLNIHTGMTLLRRDIPDCRIAMLSVVPVHEARKTPAGMFEVLEE